MLDGMGPSNPLACISLHWNIWIRITRTKKPKNNSNIKKLFARILQSCELFPVLYKIGYCSSEVVIIYPTALYKELVLKTSAGNGIETNGEISTYKFVKFLNPAKVVGSVPINLLEDNILENQYHLAEQMG